MVDFSLVGALLGAGLGIGLGAIGAGMGEGFAAAKACESIARQPSASGNIVRVMLIGQAVTETVGIFALLVALILIFGVTGSQTIDGVAFLMAGITIGIGAFGAGVGAGLPAASACEGVARKPENENKIIVNMLIGQVITQTSAIFALVVALMFIFQSHENSFLTGAALIGSGLAMGFGAVGPGLGAGIAAQEANIMVGRRPDSYKVITNLMLLGQSVAQSTSIYALVVALILMFMN
jgi:F-type H+-transporting ATPase subunit c